MVKIGNGVEHQSMAATIFDELKSYQINGGTALYTCRYLRSINVSFRDIFVFLSKSEGLTFQWINVDLLKIVFPVPERPVSMKVTIVEKLIQEVHNKPVPDYLLPHLEEHWSRSNKSIGHIVEDSIALRTAALAEELGLVQKQNVETMDGEIDITWAEGNTKLPLLCLEIKTSKGGLEKAENQIRKQMKHFQERCVYASVHIKKRRFLLTLYTEGE